MHPLTAGWPIALLPALDNSALYRKIKAGALVESGKAHVADSDRIFVKAFNCPSDESKDAGRARLSYVVNVGFISRELYHGDPDRRHVKGSLKWLDPKKVDGPRDAVDESAGASSSNAAIHAATGVIWSESSMSPNDETDGLSTTILVVENLQAGHWYDIDTTLIGFGFPVTMKNGQIPLGKGTLFESTERPLNMEFNGSTLLSAPRDWKINSDLKAGRGTRPRPSSAHEGGVNAAMCDGSCRFLNERIDPRVYLKLMTFNGAAYGEGKLRQGAY